MLDPEERADHIWHDANNAAFAAGLEVVEDKGLLGEVAGLVEWPVVLMGRIDEAFLDLPPEVLQTSMREHQKFFSVRNPKTGRIEGFVTVANTETADHGATILAGNQKVLSARLSDAKFFWENDLRTVRDVGLEGMAEGLANVTFHNKLGSQKRRIDRVRSGVDDLAPHIPGLNVTHAQEASRIAKADLQAAMVGEFPELQGTMGVYYAKAAGLPEAVANACKGHYQPLGPSDAVPTELVSVAVALADKLDTLTGFWIVNEQPTGSKDPFALRRAALGVIRLILENGLRIPLLGMLAAFGQLHVNQDADKSWQGMPENLLAFFHDRLKVHLRDEGIRYDVVDACIGASVSDDLLRISKIAPHLRDFLKTDDGGNLIQGFKRANNILTQAEEKDGVEYSYGADVKFAEDPAERTLFAALDAAEAAIDPAMAKEDFGAAMTAMAALRAPIDAFFEAVQVNADSEVVRRNRLNLLSRIRKICLSVADLTKIDG
jgi:glycyl-tRNA synthetase beta chain